MNDMTEERKQKLKNFRARLNKMNGIQESIKPIDKLKQEVEEMEKEMRKKLRACFIH